MYGLDSNSRKIWFRSRVVFSENSLERLHELFCSAVSSFTSAKLTIYGENKKVRYLARTYLWGQKLYQPLRFVFVEDEEKQVILVSTDLTMAAKDIITTYACRSKIETMFREFKQQFGGLFYHFWTKAVPKLDRYWRKSSPNPLSFGKGYGRKEKNHPDSKSNRRLCAACQYCYGNYPNAVS